MRETEILNEKAVVSSWISDLTYNRPNKVLTMRLSTGRTYYIPGVTRRTFDNWARSGSKGRFFHNFIKGRYGPKRIR